MPKNTLKVKKKKNCLKSSNLLKFPAGQSKLIAIASLKISFSNESLWGDCMFSMQHKEGNAKSVVK